MVLSWYNDKAMVLSLSVHLLPFRCLSAVSNCVSTKRAEDEDNSLCSSLITFSFLKPQLSFTVHCFFLSFILRQYNLFCKNSILLFRICTCCNGIVEGLELPSRLGRLVPSDAICCLSAHRIIKHI